MFEKLRFRKKKRHLNDLTEEEMEKHIEVSRYGTFELTDAIRPGLNFSPSEGYKTEKCVADGRDYSRLTVSASREKLIDLLGELIESLGDEVHVVLQSSHGRPADMTERVRHSIDMPVLKSILMEYEDILLNDGCAGIAVVNSRILSEVQFDEHKLFYIYYGDARRKYERILGDYGIRNREKMQVITEGEHVHGTTGDYYSQFMQLVYELGADNDESDDEY